MIENIFLLSIAAATLIFIGMMWLRQNLLHELREALSREQVLMKDLAKRRDAVPYLLESARQEAEPSDVWRRLVELRGQFLEAQPYSKELEFEVALKNYLAQNPFKGVNFLDARKDIEELSMLIDQQKKERTEAFVRFNERRKQFPYSFASAIFGFRELRD